MKNILVNQRFIHVNLPTKKCQLKTEPIVQKMNIWGSRKLSLIIIAENGSLDFPNQLTPYSRRTALFSLEVTTLKF